MACRQFGSAHVHNWHYGASNTKGVNMFVDSNDLTLSFAEVRKMLTERYEYEREVNYDPAMIIALQESIAVLVRMESEMISQFVMH
jgi:hypothetical protein